MIEKINWYPGHMKKTRELIQENLKLVDAVVEVIDARIPVSSRNPVIDDILKNKKRIVVLSKSDLADDEQNEKWVKGITKSGHPAFLVNCVTGAGTPKLLKLLSGSRVMIVGVPNAGKSSLINRLAGKKSTKTGDRPGVTRGKQWLSVEPGIQLLDMPGILWHKFEDTVTGINLAFCGAIKDEIMDIESLALELIVILASKYPKMLSERYKLDEIFESPIDNMSAIAQKRGFILPGKKIDYNRAAVTLLDEFRGGMIGRITLEFYEGI